MKCERREQPCPYPMSPMMNPMATCPYMQQMMSPMTCPMMYMMSPYGMNPYMTNPYMMNPYMMDNGSPYLSPTTQNEE